MLQGTLYCLLALAEAVVVLALISGYLFMRLRHFTHSVKGTLSRFGATADTEPHLARLDIVQYLVRELERTSSRVRSAQHGSDSAFWLPLRLAILRLEKEWSLHDDRSETFWQAATWGLEQAVKEHGLVPLRRPPRARKNDDTGLAEAAERHRHSISFLRASVHEVLEKTGEQQEMGSIVNQEFDQLEHVNHELEQCVAVLEDENKFLRDQLSALLKRSTTDAGRPPAVSNSAKLGSSDRVDHSPLSVSRKGR